MDEEQGLQSPIAGGIRGIRRSVSSSIFTGRAVPPPVAQPDPQTTSLLSQNSLTLSTVSSQLTNIADQVGSLNGSLSVIQNNLSISDTLQRQREAGRQKREAILAEQGLREGKESELEKKIQVALLSPVRRVSTFAQGILSRLTNFLLILAGGWLTDKVLTFIRLGSEGNIDALNEFKTKFLTDLAILGTIGIGLTVGVTKIIGSVGRLAGLTLKFAFGNLIKKPFSAVINFIGRNVGNFFKFVKAAAGRIINAKGGGGGLLKLLNPKNLLTLLGIGVGGKQVLKSPGIKKAITNFFKTAFGKKVVTGAVEGGTKAGGKGLLQKLGGPVFVAFEGITSIFNFRRRKEEGQTNTQAIAGSGSRLIGTLTPFLTAMLIAPEPASSLIGGIGLALLGGFVGGKAEQLSDKITGAPPSTSDGTSDAKAADVSSSGSEYEGKTFTTVTASKKTGDTSNNIVPINRKQEANVSGQLSEEVNNSDIEYVKLPDTQSGVNANAAAGGVSTKSPGDQLPNIPTSDFANNFVGLTESIYNVVV